MSHDSPLTVKLGSSLASDEKQAVQELFDQIVQPHMDGGLFFCSSKYNLDRLSEHLHNTFPCTLAGCTTAGELTSRGYQEGSIVGASFGGNVDSKTLRMHPTLIAPLSGFSIDDCEAMANELKEKLVFSSHYNAEKMFGILLVDGMSMREEETIAHLHREFREVPIVGGSAGDDLSFKNTHVYYNGRFISDAAIFTIVETELPFMTFKTQHFVPTDKKLVITEADPKNRRVLEINGEPAAQAYADILDMRVEDLSPLVFSSYPVLLQIGGKQYVRSIQQVNEDGSLSFYCAIDNGLVLTIGQGLDLVENLGEQIAAIKSTIPHPEIIIGCDCILRRLEVQQKNLSDDVQSTLRGENFLGFSTYGEQFNAIHVNQTLTGIAIG